MQTEGEWSHLTCATDRLKAETLIALLQAEGVEVSRAGGEAALGLGELPADALWVDLYVPTAQLEQARALLLAADTAAEGPDWTCAFCEESNPAAFGVCWQCSKPRTDG